MNVFEQIFADWEACVPEGDSQIPKSRLQEVLDRATARILDSGAPAQMVQDAYTLLESDGGFGYGDGGCPPMLELMLLRNGGDGAGIHFMPFWKAWHEIHRRLGQHGDKADDEPLAEEIAIFRDALLRCVSTEGGLTVQRLAAAVAAAREMSADPDAWLQIEESVAHVAKGGHIGAAALVMGRGKGEPLTADELSGLLIGWLRELSADYRRGLRAGKIKAVRDVCKCTRRAACEQLGARGWDLEEALLNFYTSSSKGQCADSGSWSSQGAKLRSSEVDCPICCEPYEGEKPVVNRCCFQVMCKACHKRLEKPGGFQCPFCRTVERPKTYGFLPGQELPSVSRSSRSHGRSQVSRHHGSSQNQQSFEGALTGLFRAAGYMATEASRGVEEFAVAWREEMAPPERARLHSNLARQGMAGR